LTPHTRPAPARQIPGFAKAAMQFQAFLLRRNWMGPLANEIMVITTTGRKSGQQFSTPIGYLRDGDSLIALAVGGASHWYKNLLVNPEVTLNLKGQDLRARAEVVRHESERQHIFERYQRDRAKFFARLFGVPVDAPAEALAHALATRQFVRFVRIN
jgi:deazaflavin-dependent oxidoreductase (nitroreductase family)